MKGYCKCGVLLDENTCSPAALESGHGPCKKCRNEYMKMYTRKNKEKIRENSKRNYSKHVVERREYRRKRYLVDRDKNLAWHRVHRYTIKGRFAVLKSDIKKEGVPSSDPLWSMNYYAEIIRDGVCHYCLGNINPTSHALDRMDNSLAHVCFNVVPCCWFCNSLRSTRFSFEEMMKIAPILRDIRLSRDDKQLSHPRANFKGRLPRAVS